MISIVVDVLTELTVLWVVLGIPTVFTEASLDGFSCVTYIEQITLFTTSNVHHIFAKTATTDYGNGTVGFGIDDLGILADEMACRLAFSPRLSCSLAGFSVTGMEWSVRTISFLILRIHFLERQW